MVRIILGIGLVVLVCAIAGIFILRSILRRQSQKGKNNILKLRPGRAHYVAYIEVPFSGPALLRVSGLLAQNNFRIIDNVQDGLIAYSGKSEKAVLGGWLNINPYLLPFRIIITGTPEGKTRLQFDDDYGFQVLNARQIQKFNEIYKPVFMHYESLIKSLY